MPDACHSNTFARVVVGVDATDFGYEALRQALALAPAESTIAAVTALDVGVAAEAGFLAREAEAELEEQAAAGQAVATEILVGRPQHSATVVRGEARRVLRHACKAREATLLALGGRARSRFLGMLTGETAGAFVHDGDISVLLARPQWGERWQPRRVSVGVDGSAPSLAALAVADDLAERLGSVVQVVSAKGGKALTADGDWHDRVTTWLPEHPVAALVAQSTLADLVIVGSRGLHGVHAIGSVSESVAHRAHCSTLVVHAANGEMP